MLQGFGGLGQKYRDIILLKQKSPLSSYESYMAKEIEWTFWGK